MSSGAQAQIAASQAASAASAEAAANALAFSKEIFNYQRGQRQPYVDAGHSSLSMLMGLLGLQPGLVHNPGLSPGGGSGTLRSMASGGGGAPSGGSPGGSSPGRSAPPPPTNTYSKPVTGPVYGSRPDDRFNPVMKAPYSGIDLGTGRPITPPSAPKLLSVSSGGSGGSKPLSTGADVVMVTSPDGAQHWTSASMVPFYQARGFTIGD